MTMGVPQKRWMVYKGKHYSHGWFRATPISGQLYVEISEITGVPWNDPCFIGISSTNHHCFPHWWKPPCVACNDGHHQDSRFSDPRPLGHSWTKRERETFWVVDIHQKLAKLVYFNVYIDDSFTDNPFFQPYWDMNFMIYLALSSHIHPQCMSQLRHGTTGTSSLFRSQTPSCSTRNRRASASSARGVTSERSCRTVLVEINERLCFYHWTGRFQSWFMLAKLVWTQLQSLLDSPSLGGSTWASRSAGSAFFLRI